MKHKQKSSVTESKQTKMHHITNQNKIIGTNIPPSKGNTPLNLCFHSIQIKKWKLISKQQITQEEQLNTQTRNESQIW